MSLVRASITGRPFQPAAHTTSVTSPPLVANCNTRKSARLADEWPKVSNHWTVKGKHGEPVHWDGLASVFVLLARQVARQAERPLTAAEKGWLLAFEAHYAELGVR